MTVDPIPASMLLRGRCCRDWPLAPLSSIGRCGLCGERPDVLGLWDQT